jgi:FkbM family methyltransferase
MFREYAEKKINDLKEGTDARSSEVLDYALKCMEYMKFLKNVRFESVSLSLPDYQLVHEQNWEEERDSCKKKYDLCGEWHAPEVFYFHHGLRLADQKILDHVRGRDIMDCGAFVGDSLLILRKYTDKNVYCYECANKNVKKFEKVMKRNKIATGYKLIPVALGEIVGRIRSRVPEVTSSEVSLTKSGDDVIEMTTIDAEADKYRFDLGFIKMDVEGYGMPIIKGAINTIRSQRPVLSLGIYHSHEELFDIKPFLQKQLTDYVYEFHLQQFTAGDFNEMILLCYPKELLDSDR